MESKDVEIGKADKDTSKEGSTVLMTEEMIPSAVESVADSDLVQERKESEDRNVCGRNDEGMDEKIENHEMADEKMVENEVDEDLKLDLEMENKDVSSEVKKDESLEKVSSVELDSGAKTGPSEIESDPSMFDPTKVKIEDEQDLVKCEVKTEDGVATVESTNESAKISENDKVEENVVEAEEERPPPVSEWHLWTFE